MIIGVSLLGGAEISSGETAFSIPVLCYHRFGKNTSQDAYSLDLEEFRRQLEIIREEEFTPITAAGLADGRLDRALLPEKPLLITIDDGYKHFNTTARPLLEEFNFPATLFIYTNFVGARAGFSRSQLRELQSAGFEIGSHSATHPKLTRRPRGETKDQRAERLRQELSESREKLTKWCRGEVISLSYPYGLWDREVAEAARQAGYKLMFTVNPGPNTLETPPERLKRIMILRGTRDSTFRNQLREKPLLFSASMPGWGERAISPVRQMIFTLTPEMLSCIDPASLEARRRSSVVPLEYDAQSGRVIVRFSPPWVRGTDLIILTAQDQEGKNRFKNSRLLIVE
jgi:peptidoglycan/xylan/chitin deacetylase (PgdA/CDA1 family)